MGRRPGKKSGARKHAKAIRRRKKLDARARKDRRRPTASPPVELRREAARPPKPPRPPAPTRPVRPRPWALWDPGVRGVNPRRLPALQTDPGPGPTLYGIPLPHERRIALYARTQDGQTGPVLLGQLPLDQVVTWVEEPPVLRDALASEVSWRTGPRLDGGVVRGDVVVHYLVDTEEGTIWSPVVPIMLTGQGEAREVDVGGEAGGVLRRDGVEWDWGSGGTHVRALCAFLDDQAALLWRVLDGGPGLDAAWRVRALRGPSPIYKHWAVDDVLGLGERAVPPLLAILDGVLVDPADEESHDVGPFYALSLLAHIGSREAHDRFLALARLPAGRFERWFGGYLTEQFDAALLRTSGGNVDGIVGLVQDRHSDGYLRAQAADALVAAVALGHADRREVLAMLAGQLQPDASVDPGSYIWSGVGTAILDLHGVGYLDQLVEACESGLIEPLTFSADHVREQLGSDPQPYEPGCLELVQTQDVHAWIASWACFDDSP